MDDEALVQQIAEAQHRTNEHQYDVCDHGTYAGGPNHGEPYAMCEIQARAVLPLVEAQVAPLRDEVERLNGLLERATAALERRAVEGEERADAAESALRQVRELHVKVDHAWEDKHWCEADGREWPCQTIAILDSARVGAADTQPEGAGGIVTPGGITPGGMQVCPDCGRWGSNVAGLCVNNFHDAAQVTPTAGSKVDTAPEEKQ